MTDRMENNMNTESIFGATEIRLEILIFLSLQSCLLHCLVTDALLGRNGYRLCILVIWTTTKKSVSFFL